MNLNNIISMNISYSLFDMNLINNILTIEKINLLNNMDNINFNYSSLDNIFSEILFLDRNLMSFSKNEKVCEIIIKEIEGTVGVKFFINPTKKK